MAGIMIINYHGWRHLRYPCVMDSYCSPSSIGFVVGFALAVAACTPQCVFAAENLRDLTAPTEIQGVPCQGRVKYFENGRIQVCTLARDHTILDQPLPAGTQVFFSADGRLREFLLGREAVVYGQLWPAYSRLWTVDKLGQIRVWPAKDIVVQGHLLKMVDDGIGHYLYPDGKVRALWLRQDEVIDGVPCTSSSNVIKMPVRVAFMGTERMAWFYPDGHL